jgi:hypothetical protein
MQLRSGRCYSCCRADCTIYPSIDVHSISPIYTPIERGG